MKEIAENSKDQNPGLSLDFTGILKCTGNASSRVRVQMPLSCLRSEAFLTGLFPLWGGCEGEAEKGGDRLLEISYITKCSSLNQFFKSTQEIKNYCICH